MKKYDTQSMIHEKTNLSHKFTSVTDGFKSSKSDGEIDYNYVSQGNDNNIISFVKNNSNNSIHNNSEQNNKNIIIEPNEKKK